MNIRPRLRLLAAGCALLCLLAACTGESAEERAKKAAQKIKESIPNTDAIALAQRLDPAVVKEVQAQLTVISEYQGDVDGKLDPVTINALQAFQRSAGLPDTGILDQRTRERLRATAAAAEARGKQASG